MRHLASFFKLPLSQKKLTIQAAILIPSVHIGLRIVPFQRFRSFLGWLGGRPTVMPSKPAIKSVIKAIDQVQPYVGGTCLDRALTAQLLFGRQGFKTDLRIGVRRDKEGKFAAHAWVESGGRILIGGTAEELTEYVRMPTLDGVTK